MSEIVFVNSGYNVAEPMNIHFNYTTNRNLFLYFQGPVTCEGKTESSGACILYTADFNRNYLTGDGFVNSYLSFYAPRELFSKLGIRTNKVFYPSNCGDINDIILKMCNENALRDRGFEEKLQALILDLLVTTARGSNPKTESDRATDTKNKLTALRAEFLSDVSVTPVFDELLRSAGISRTLGYKLYSKYFHSSPKEDLIWARLEKSRELMRLHPEMKIYEIAEQCGFLTTSHFFRTFKSRYGYPPKDYMNALKK